MQAFKFPDSMNVHFQCVIQVCRNQCPEPKCDGGLPGLGGDLGYAASTSQAVGVDPRVPGTVSSASAPINSRAGTSGTTYKSVNRDGEAASTSTEARQFLGKPRMVSDDTNSTSRRRRDADESVVLHVYKRDAQEMTDVPTTRIIQVVAPGDVAFTLNPNQNETVVVQNLSGAEMDGNHICLSVPSFVGGLTMLLLVLIIACMVSVFLLLRVRQFDGKGGKSSSSLASLAHIGIDHPEFVKCSK